MRPDGAGTLTLSVTDTGAAWNPGWRKGFSIASTRSIPLRQGLGLGLSLCRLIVEKLGGTIGLDTTYTGGARFVVTLRVPDLQLSP